MGVEYETVQVTRQGALGTITFNRPKKFNAINLKMYEEIVSALDELSNDDSISIVATTGAGNFYCSGNDLTNFMNAGDDQEKASEMAASMIRNFVAKFIDFPKPLIALVNGPAIGLSVTLLGLYDVVLASDKATFHTPFTTLGQSPEGCSTYTFPRILGPSKAKEMLLFNKKLTAQDACAHHLVSEVIPHGTFRDETNRRLLDFSQLPPKSMMYGKQLTRDMERRTLHATNAAEIDRLKERWLSEECMNAVVAFLQRRAKL